MKNKTIGFIGIALVAALGISAHLKEASESPKPEQVKIVQTPEQKRELFLNRGIYRCTEEVYWYESGAIQKSHVYSEQGKVTVDLKNPSTYHAEGVNSLGGVFKKTKDGYVNKESDRTEVKLMISDDSNEFSIVQMKSFYGHEYSMRVVQYTCTF